MNTTLTCPAHGGGEKHIKVKRKRVKGKASKKKANLKRKMQTEQKRGGRRSRKEEGEVKQKDQIQKWGHNMVIAVRVTEIESGE